MASSTADVGTDPAGTADFAVPAATLALIFGTATIATAWGFQLIGGFAPCKLCLEQRVPYYVALPVLAAGLLAHRLGAARAVLRAALLVAAAAFAYGLALAIYHAGAEWAFWPGPADCGGGVATTSDAGSLLAQMQATRLVSCTEASWRMLGLSFAGWNAVASAALLALTLAGALARGRTAR